MRLVESGFSSVELDSVELDSGMVRVPREVSSTDVVLVSTNVSENRSKKMTYQRWSL